MRPHQYLKNLFIFLPLFFGIKFDDFHLLLQTGLAFIAFSLTASAVYIFNDYHDLENDRKHPQKGKRPLAAGKVSKKSALILMILLATAGIGISLLLSFSLFGLFVLYLSLNLFYSLWIKHIPILDVFVIAIGFVIRLFVGSEVGSVELSMWILIMTFLLALFLALAKRRDDVLIYFQGGDKTRRVVDGYNLEFLNSAMIIISSVIIVAYIMYTVTEKVINFTGSSNLYLTTLFVILGILRYLQITLVENESGSPTRILLKDRFLQMVLLAWVSTFAWILYWNKSLSNHF